jgi:hypothetical protein
MNVRWIIILGIALVAVQANGAEPAALKTLEEKVS